MIPLSILQTELNLFIDELRLAGYKIGLEQFIQVQTWLQIQDKIPEDLRELKVFLRPLLCHSQKEQEEFDAYFEPWVDQVIQKHKVVAEEVVEDQPISDERPLPLHETISKCCKLNWKVLVIFLVFQVLILGIFFFIPNDYNQYVDNGSMGTPTTTTDDSTKNLIMQDPNLSTEPESIQKVIVIKTNKMTLTDWLIMSAALFLVPLLILSVRLWIWWWNRRQLAHVKHFLTRVSNAKGFRLHLNIKGITNKLFQPLSFTGSKVQPPILTSQHLDIEASIEKTLQAGGYPIPIIRSNKPLHYLILIERLHFADHQADWFDNLVASVVFNDEIEWNHYYFNVDPRNCYSDPHNLTVLKLSELGDQYPRSHLIIFSNSEKLIDPVTGKTVSWLDELALWSNRTLLTLEPLEQIAGREHLKLAGFMILPLNEESIMALAEGTERKFLDKEAKWAPFPHLLTETPQQWMERHVPADEAWVQLQPQLHRFLGEKGYYWLSACAVYPQLQWSLTLYLGDNLNLASEKLFRQALLAKLVQLPWFRHGSMPNWLRERLIADLSPSQEQAIRKLLFTLLENTSQLNLEVDWTTELEQEALVNDALYVTSMAEKLSVEIPDKFRNTLNLSPEAAKNPFLSPKLYLMGGVVTLLLVVIALVFVQPFSKLLGQKHEALFYPLSGHTGAVLSVAFSYDGKFLASGSRDKTVRLWDVATRAPFGKKILRGHTKAVMSVAFNPHIITQKKFLLASGSMDNTVILWDIEKLGSDFYLKEHTSGVISLSFSPNGKLLASGSKDNTVILWNVKTQTILSKFSGHSSGVRSLAFSPDGKRLASASMNTTVILWDVGTPDKLENDTKHTDKDVLILDFEKQDPLDIYLQKGDIIMSIAFSPDGKHLATVTDDKIILWGIDNKQVLSNKPLNNISKRSIDSIAFNPDDGKQLAIASDDSVGLWEIDKNNYKIIGVHPNISSVAFSPDGKTIASGSKDKTVILWDIATERTSKEYAAGLIIQGEQLLQLSKVKKAIDKFKKAEKMDPNIEIPNATTLFDQGKTLEKQSKIEQAIAKFKAAKEMSQFDSDQRREIIMQIIKLKSKNDPTGPSFDCAKAATIDENTICSNSELSYADRWLGTLYTELKKILTKPEEASLLKKEGRAWLKKRADCSKNDIISCLLKTYANRINDLEKNLKSRN